jgi:hypothetical protein
VHLFSVFSLRNRALIALITIVIGVLGGPLSPPSSRVDPSLSLPSVFIRHVVPGASPDEHRCQLLDALPGIENLDSTTATSTPRRRLSLRWFAHGTDIATRAEGAARPRPQNGDSACPRASRHGSSPSASRFPGNQLAVTTATWTPIPSPAALPLSRWRIWKSAAEGVQRCEPARAASSADDHPGCCQAHRRRPQYPVHQDRPSLPTAPCWRVDRSPKTARRSPCSPVRESPPPTKIAALPLLGARALTHSHHCGCRHRRRRERSGPLATRVSTAAGGHAQHHGVRRRQHGDGVPDRAGDIPALEAARIEY